MFLKGIDFCGWISAVSLLHSRNWGVKNGKVKCTLVQALRLCRGSTAHRESRGITVLFLDHGTRRERGVNVTPRPFFTAGKDPVPIAQEAGWSPWPVWAGAEYLTLTGIRSPDRPARSSVSIPTELPGPRNWGVSSLISYWRYWNFLQQKYSV